VCLRARNEEAVYWVWALVAFGPLSGIVPLPFPLADRYLYFMLPGLIGASLLAAPQLADRIVAALGARVDRRLLGRGALACAAVWTFAFAVQAHARAHVWKSAETMMADAELNYPDGAAAQTRKAGRASRAGDFDQAVRYLEAAHARGYNRLDHILTDPSYGPMQNHPAFVELKQTMAREWIERLGASGAPSQVEARMLAQAFVVLEDFDAALAVIEAAAERPGPMTEDLRGDAVKLRDEIARRERFARARERAAAKQETEPRD
jgi:tetratricopeptide (TPR) repeat protein